MIIKTCSCKRTHTLIQWLSLPFVGVMGDEDERIELRNCHCASTIAIEAPRVSFVEEAAS